MGLTAFSQISRLRILHVRKSSTFPWSCKLSTDSLWLSAAAQAGCTSLSEMIPAVEVNPTQTEGCLVDYLVICVFTVVILDVYFSGVS